MRVALAPNMGCGRCDLCLRGETQLCPDYISFGVGLDGGFAEYMRLPRESIQQGNVVEIPHGLDFEAAALAEPLSCAYRGMMACRPGLGDVILIVGAGPIGLMHLQVARSLGAGTVIVSSHSEQRGREATRLGADVVINPRRESLIESVLAATGGRGADIAIVAAPSAEAQAQCVELMNVHGRINFFGGIPPGEAQTPINANRVHYRELCITGTTGQTVRDYRAAMRLIAERRVDVASLVSHRYSLGEICEAVQSARAKIGLKVMVCPGG
jgi:threonine dehydrogenase-like Zn-dependent dehydrogenase